MNRTPQQVSQEHSYIGPRDVRPFEMKDVKGWQNLRKIGIALDERAVGEMMNGLHGMDSNQALITTASISTPIQFLQKWLQGFVRTITNVRTADELVGIQTIGEWGQEEVVQGVQEITGGAVPYGDYTEVNYASWNQNYERRTIVRFDQGMRVGRLEEYRASAVQANSAEIKRESCAEQLEVERNYVAFNGYNSGNNRTWGFLNDPNLPGYVNVAAGASASLLWSSKTMLEVIADIRTAIVALRTQSGGNIDPRKVNITLAVPTNAVDRLSTISDLGYSVEEWLQKTYPRIRVVDAPQLNTANGGVGVFYLYAEQITDRSTDDGRTFVQIVPTKFMVVGVSQQTKGYEEDYSNGTAGVMLKRPWAVVRYSGIS